MTSVVRFLEQTDTKIPEKFIEAMVVVDKSVIELLGSKENVTRYILTLLRMVSEAMVLAGICIEINKCNQTIQLILSYFIISFHSIPFN